MFCSHTKEVVVSVHASREVSTQFARVKEQIGGSARETIHPGTTTLGRLCHRGQPRRKPILVCEIFHNKVGPTENCIPRLTGM